MMAFARFSACALLVVSSLIHSTTGEDTSSLPPEPQLMADLMKRAEKFGKYVRPVSQPSESLDVSFGLRVVKIAVDTQHSRLTISAWCRVRWYDEHLTWNSSHYSGINRIYMPIHMIWTPDITLVNSAKAIEEEENKALLSLRSDGRVFWTPLRVFDVPCLITLQDYPWDEYSCDMWFQSIAYSDNALNPQLYYYGTSTPLDLDTYLGNFRKLDEWEIVHNTTAEVKQPRELGVILMYSRRKSLRMTLTLRRRTGFMALLLTIPCIVFSVMSCLVFCIPPTRPDRLAFGNSLFSAFVVFMLILAATVPPTSGAFPKLGVFYGFNSILIILAIFLSVISINISKRGESGATIPPCINKVMLQVLGPLLLLPPPKPLVPPHAHQTQMDLNLTPWYGEAHTTVTSQSSTTSTTNELTSIKSKCPQCHPIIDTILGDLVEVSQKVTSIKQELNRLCISPSVSNGKQWLHLSVVVDRLFAITYCLAVGIGLGVLFPWPKSR